MLFVLSAGFFYFARNETKEMIRRYREATEEPLIDFAYAASALISSLHQRGDTSFSALNDAVQEIKKTHLSARVYDYEKNSVDIEIIITDKLGKIIFDSSTRYNRIGKDFSEWIDIAKALKGEYGARTSREDLKIPDTTMYISAPLKINGTIEGVVSIVKSNKIANLFIRSANTSLINAALYILFITLLLVLLLSTWITRPLKKLTLYVQKVAKEREVKAPHLPKGEIYTLFKAFDDLRHELEGKKYVEKYIQTITHALKSPITSIKGSAEILLEKNLDQNEKEKFIDTILSESERLHGTVNKLLSLTSIQAQQFLQEFSLLNLIQIIEDTVKNASVAAQAKNIYIQFHNYTNREQVEIYGHVLWLQEAFNNILQNAIEFSPPYSPVQVLLEEDNGSYALMFKDNGSGIPDWAFDKIWDQFFSLPRPESNKKSSGLGLSIVNEVILKHGAKINVSRNTPNGIKVKIIFPSPQVKLSKL
jgi:two-component system, OmpR family, sensor histidine kinase CreC